MTDQALTGSMLIGAHAVYGTVSTFRASNPATGLELDPVYGGGGAADVERACALAEAAFDIYRETTLEERAAFLESIASEILALGDALIDRTVQESGLPRGRIEGERGRNCPDEGGCRAPATDPGLRRDEQHQPGVPHARRARPSGRHHRQGLCRFAHPWRGAVLHQSGLGVGRGWPRPRYLPRRHRRSPQRLGSRHHVDRRYPPRLRAGGGALVHLRRCYPRGAGSRHHWPDARLRCGVHHRRRDFSREPAFAGRNLRLGQPDRALPRRGDHAGNRPWLGRTIDRHPPDGCGGQRRRSPAVADLGKARGPHSGQWLSHRRGSQR